MWIHLFILSIVALTDLNILIHKVLDAEDNYRHAECDQDVDVDIHGYKNGYCRILELELNEAKRALYEYKHPRPKGWWKRLCRKWNFEFRRCVQIYPELTKEEREQRGLKPFYQ